MYLKQVRHERVVSIPIEIRKKPALSAVKDCRVTHRIDTALPVKYENPRYYLATERAQITKCRGGCELSVKMEITVYGDAIVKLPYSAVIFLPGYDKSAENLKIKAGKAEINGDRFVCDMVFTYG